METNTIITLLSLLASVVAAIAGVYAVIYSREQLKLARDQAEMRPKITISVDEDEPIGYVQAPQMTYGEPYNAYIVFFIRNTGKVAAHHVICKFQFEEKILEPVDYSDFSVSWAGPEQVYRYDVKLRTHSHGSTKISYSAICDEIGRVDDSLLVYIA